MIIKHYIVNTMNEAMTRIRYELGRDAVIISQRKIRKPGIKGFFSAKSIEVTAAVENEVNEKKQNTVNDNGNGRNSNELNNIELNSIEAIKKVVQQENENVNHSRVVQKQNNSVHKVSNQSDNNSENLMSEMMKMKTMISELSLERELSQVGKPMENQKSDIEKILFDNDVDSENIENIIRKIKNDKTEKTDLEKLKIILKEMIHITKPKLQGRIVLVGPTGVGKTTTIAKLAGKLALAEGKKVGLITVDTYRIGAVEQLKAYADIMNLPFKVVYNMNDMDKAIKSMSECEVVLIDTTGRSSKNKMQIAELRTFVEKADTKDIHLVLSSTTKNRDMKYIIEGYRILNYNSIIVTKLDETATYGSILNILETAKIPLSFVSIGQNVPDDIEELSADSIVSLILGEDTIC
ncbi:flagellar biosynthesis protein FlhF [Clostridium estertheticum]|uniref:flagellar biosynthesis protein FlhF n=1 Tax=Clostridium estertheticum TaxID=238834 RepID=UPI001CF1DB47|nr:flagellar biosynthesis protein FlhF [Clostridium estertheticum]MCB2308765.1 flagellar biosynthesis protein FlhF [Clostridium estertheticum]MCB2347157.1 flagellar biosynthesis protein FlhF [Clostridium estertheticum]MCB2351751.1 flagellar biosynthesis protein FlhF [Clostridium estertheticum]WAG44525.1 flagellar biosynthesis protein FlhF [Clostridium estertheticum]